MTDGPADIPLDYKQPTSHTGRRPNHNKRLVIGAVLLSLLVPALILTSVCSSIPAQIHRMHCQSNMRRIGYALQAYAHDHGGQFPDRLGTLIRTTDIQPWALVCDATGDQSSTAPTTQAVADDVDAGRNVSYTYLGGGLTAAAPADTVLLYEPLKNHGNRMNVLLADGSVEWLVRRDALDLLKRIKSGARPVRYSTTQASSR